MDTYCYLRDGDYVFRCICLSVVTITSKPMLHVFEICFYCAPIAYHLGLNAYLGSPQPTWPTLEKRVLMTI